MTTPDDDSDGASGSSSTMFSPEAWLTLTQNLHMPSINCYQHLSTQCIDQLVDIEMQRLKGNCRREEDHYVEQMLLENPIIVERRSQQQPLAVTATATETSTSTLTTTTKQTTYEFAAAKTNGNCQQQQKEEEEQQQHEHQQQQLCHSGNGCKQMVVQHMDITKQWMNVVVNVTAAAAAAASPSTRERVMQQRADSCRRSRINNKIKKAKMKYRHKFMSTKLMQSVGMLECMQHLIDQTETQLMHQGFNARQLQELRSIFSLDRD